MILGCGRIVVPCQFRGVLCLCVLSSASPQFRGHMDFTEPGRNAIAGNKRPEKYRQVSGRRACAWMAVCKTVGLAYVGSNPAPATIKLAGQTRSSGPGLMPSGSGLRKRSLCGTSRGLVGYRAPLKADFVPSRVVAQQRLCHPAGSGNGGRSWRHTVPFGGRAPVRK